MAANIPTPDPGVYRWWFTEQDTLRLLAPFNGSITLSNLQALDHDGKKYYALYIGISKNDLIGRYKWHLNQKHSAATIHTGFLSTMRRSISALLQTDCTQSEQAVTDMLKRSIFEWDVTPNFEQIETTELQTNLYPLNVQKNVMMQPQDLAVLKNLRKLHKK